MLRLIAARLNCFPVLDPVPIRLIVAQIWLGGHRDCQQALDRRLFWSRSRYALLCRHPPCRNQNSPFGYPSFHWKISSIHPRRATCNAMSIILCRDRLTSRSSGQRLNKLILCTPSPALVTSQHLCICLRIFSAAVSSSTSIASIWNTSNNTEPASNTAYHQSCSQKLKPNNAMDLVYIFRPSSSRMPLLDIPHG